ncbi:MAG TPA: XRE family transcriptional regulator, partial [Anaerolineaceae bacterium]|nr:XRE family transcriptional regulator [Anaerolineaceae bacterium]
STLGERLRDLRQSRDLTLKQVSDDTGLSLSFLSLIERDKVSISVDNLEHLARFYGIRLVNLFQDLQDSSTLVTRKAQIEKQMENVQPGKSDFSLLAFRSGARMEPLLIQIGPGHGDRQFRTLEGDMFLYVLQGEIKLISERGEDVILAEGDSAYYYGFPGHRIENASPSSPARLLLVTTPPTTLRDDVLDRRQGVLLQSED